MPSPAPVNAFRILRSPADLHRINAYLRYCQTPAGRLEWFLDTLKYEQTVRAAWGNGSCKRTEGA